MQGGISMPSKLLFRSSPLLVHSRSTLCGSVPQGGFPTELNLSGWANLVQDMVAGLQALPPRLSLDMGHEVVALLQLLEAATGVGFCRHCCHPRPHCMCTDRWHLLQASPLQISPFGAYLLRRPLHPQGYWYPCDTGLPWGGPPN